ncbi:zinc metalloproteinase nas-5-like [Anopheles stephensi]|uniref:zinc metalloproteinase nas-5-like n=1 Tax=Anopheles stephensi TaxID=30069 RepID=UPI0016587BC2|nr:zinc metalloproteinase nas-5-like [Anopheles stephensi]
MVHRLLIVISLLLMFTRRTDKYASVIEECPPRRPQYGNVMEHVLPKGYRWANATVPYILDGDFDDRELSNIRGSMDLLTRLSCLQFKQRTTENHYLVVTNKLGTGCWADTGRQPRGPTYMNLSQQCTHRPGTILHELLHVIGLLHQHTRPDRDHYLCVLYDNILAHPVALYNYEIVHPWTELAFPLPYDFESIMHYTPEMYSVAPGRLATMVPRHPWGMATLGQRERLTEYDVLAIQFLYCVS